MEDDLTTEFKFMGIALFVAYKALREDETPVACIFVENSTHSIIGVGYNYTNKSLNGTKHAEFIAIEEVFQDLIPNDNRGDIEYITNFFQNVTLYVTVEPCIMCASALGQLGVGKVVFGCANDRFGGNGTVLAINQDMKAPGNYKSYGGILRTEAVQLLRNFYIQENPTAPQPKVKKNRDIEGKDFPPNLQFDKYLSNEDFIKFYGASRLDYFLEQKSSEITPITSQGYSLRELIDLKDLISSSAIKRLYANNTQAEEEIAKDLDTFFSLFYDVDSQGALITTKDILNVSELTDLRNSGNDPKKRKIE